MSLSDPPVAPSSGERHISHTPTTELRAARARELASIHQAVCRAKRQGLVCSTCRELNEQAARLTYHHDAADPKAALTPCEPRISLDCSRCKRSVIFCHLASAVIEAYVNPAAPRWLCSACSEVS